MKIANDIALPWWEKCTLTIKEASMYFGIGEKTLRRFIREHKDESFVFYNGTKAQIVKKDFEKYISNNLAVI